MADSVKDKVTGDLKQATDAGKMRSDRVREIITAAVAQIQQELSKVRAKCVLWLKMRLRPQSLGFRTQGGEVKASIEGIIDGISSTRRTAIAETEAKVKQLQQELEEQEDQLEKRSRAALLEFVTQAKKLLPKFGSRFKKRSKLCKTPKKLTYCGSATPKSKRN
jgi:F0F1-type ATP synthase membrane subunit b/b'